MLKKIIKDFSIYGLMPFLPKFASLLILPLITPYLNATDYGVYGVIISYVTLLKVFSSLGLDINLSNSFFKSRLQYKWLWKQIYGFLVIWNLLFALILGMVIYFIIPVEAKNNFNLIIFLCVTPYLIFGPTATIAENFYQLKRMPFQIVVRNLIGAILTLIFTFYFIRVLKMGYMGWFWANFITSIFINISWWYSLNRINKITPIYNFKRKTIIKALKIGLPILPHSNALLILNQSDRILLERLNISTTQIGLYNITYNIANIFDMVGFAFSKAITPYILDLLQQKKEHILRKIIFYSQILFFCAAIFTSLIAKELLEVLVRNDKLNTEYGLMVLIVMSMIFKPMYIITTTRVLFNENTSKFGIQSLYAGILNVVLNIILIPFFGIKAAAITTFVGFAFLSYSRFWTQEYKRNSTLNYYPIIWVIASLTVCIFGYYAAMLPIKIRLFLILPLFLFSLYIIVMAKKDFQNLE